jgi:hypothetical protein
MFMKIVCFIASLIPCAALAQSFILTAPQPQAFTNSCQSYAVAFALGTAPGSAYPVRSTGELRSLEIELRKRIEDVAKKQNSTPDRLEVWQVAVFEHTSGRYKLHSQAFPDVSTALRKVGELTQTTVGEPLALGPFVPQGGTPVLLSMEAILNSAYPSGHIVTALGVGGPLNSPKSLLVLNGAVKTGPKTASSCQTIGDEKYAAELQFLRYPTDFLLKKYADGYHVMWIARP